MRARGYLRFGLASSLMLAACGGGALPGHYFEITASGSDNGCTSEAPSDYTETFTYRLDVVAANDVTVYIDDVVLATGGLDGCEISYRSPLFTDVRGEDTIRWALIGKATISLGDNASCGAGEGWIGTERIEISSSTADDVAPGCSYKLDVEGTYLEEVE